MGEDLKFSGCGLLSVNRNDNALAAKFLCRLFDKLRICNSCGIDRNLVCTRQKQIADVIQCAHTSANREGHETGFSGAFHHIQHRAPVFVGRHNIEKAQFISPRRVIGAGRLNRITGIAQVNEVDAFDHTAIFHIEAGNDPGFQHRMVSATSFKAKVGSSLPS